MNVVFIVLSKPSVKRQDRVRREDNEKRFDEFFSELSTEKLVWVLRKVADSTEEYERLRVCFILLASKEYFFFRMFDRKSWFNVKMQIFNKQMEHIGLFILSDLAGVYLSFFKRNVNVRNSLFVSRTKGFLLCHSATPSHTLNSCLWLSKAGRK